MGQVTHHPSDKSFRQPDFPLKYRLYPQFNSSPLKIYRDPKGTANVFLSHHFSGLFAANFGVCIDSRSSTGSFVKETAPTFGTIFGARNLNKNSDMYVAGWPCRKGDKFFCCHDLYTPLKTNECPLLKGAMFNKKYIFQPLIQPLIFRGHVSFRGGTPG